MEGVEALPPGTWALWREGILRAGAYWSLPEAAPTIHRRGEAVELLRPLLRDAAALLGEAWSPMAPYDGGGRSLPSLRRPASSWDALHATVAMELRAYMLNQLLRDSDVFGMAHSLEIRVPLIDHKLVEAIFQIEPRLFLQGPAKGLLLDSLASPLPRLCTHRPKMGFTFPFDRWMRGPWRSWFEERLMDGVSSREAPFDPVALRALWRDYLAGKVHWSRPWSCLVLQQALARRFEVPHSP
ncbi:MAG: asparagine synthase-related protein [Acidobacteriota bacterium]